MLVVGPTDTTAVPTTCRQPAVYIRWQSSDFAAFPTDYVASLTAAGTSPSPLPSETSRGNSSQPGGDSDGGLSRGAKIGIGVGASLGGLLLLVLLVLLFFVLRRRKSPPLHAPQPGARELHGVEAKKAELNTEEAALELATKPVGIELPAERDLAGLVTAQPASTELSAQRDPAELAAVEALTGRQNGNEGRTRLAADLQAADRRDAAVELDGTARAKAAGTARAAEELEKDATAEDDEETRLVEEEKRLADQRAALQETLRIRQEDERLRLEQEAVRERLRELRRK